MTFMSPVLTAWLAYSSRHPSVSSILHGDIKETSKSVKLGSATSSCVQTITLLPKWFCLKEFLNDIEQLLFV